MDQSLNCICIGYLAAWPLFCFPSQYLTGSCFTDEANRVRQFINYVSWDWHLLGDKDLVSANTAQCLEQACM